MNDLADKTLDDIYDQLEFIKSALEKIVKALGQEPES